VSAVIQREREREREREERERERERESDVYIHNMLQELNSASPVAPVS